MKKRIISAVLAAMLCMGAGASAAEHQRMDITADGNGVSSNLTKTTLDDQTVYSLAGNSQTMGSSVIVTFGGYDTLGKRISADKRYMVVHYMLKNNTETSALNGLKPTFQIDVFGKTNEDGSEEDIKNGNAWISSGFTTGATAFQKGEWAPLMVKLDNSKILGVVNDYPGAWYKTLRMYPSWSTENNTMSDDDTLYMKYVDFYTEQPSNVVYNPSVTISNGTVSGKARLYQFDGAEKGCVMLLAQYDKNGNLINCKVNEIAASQLTAGFNDISTEAECSASKDIDAKLFIWDSLTDMNALCDAQSASYNAPISNDNEVSYSIYGMGAVNPKE